MSSARPIMFLGTLRARLVAMVGALLLVSAGVLGVTFYLRSRHLLEGELSNRGQSLARSLAFHATYGVLTRDEVLLAESAEWTLAQPGVASVRIMDASGRVLITAGDAAEPGSGRAPARRTLTFTAPVTSSQTGDVPADEELLAIPFASDRKGARARSAGIARGSVEVGLSTAELEDELGRQAMQSTLMVFAFLLVGAAGLYLFLRVVVSPIHRLAAATVQIAAGDFSRRVHVRGHDEIALLAASFNTMVESLLRSREQIERDEADLENRVRERTVQLQRANEELKAAQNQLVQAEKLSAVGQLVSGVAHELNNPLTGVLGYAQLLEASAVVPEQVKRHIRAIHHEAERCRRIVADLLTFARSHHITRRPVDLNLLISSTLEGQSQTLSNAAVRVNTVLEPGAMVTSGDAHMLQQVLVNLIGNARDALMTGTGPRRLDVRTMSSGGEIRIMVSDNGPGIPADVMGRIFEPFFTTKEVGKGTGLGLSLCYGIVKEHGGRIQAFNNPDGGATFLVSLPGKRAERLADGGEEFAPAAGPLPGPPHPDAPRSQASCLHVLVVDDEPSIPDLIEEILSAQGHRVTKATNGNQAVELLSAHRFDLILSDLRMPGLDGMGLYRETRRRWPELLGRLVFITGDQANEETKAFLAGIGARSIGKPFNLADLQKVVEETSPRAPSGPLSDRASAA